MYLLYIYEYIIKDIFVLRRFEQCKKYEAIQYGVVTHIFIINIFRWKTIKLQFLFILMYDMWELYI